MFNKSSIYALNKKDPDAIVYPSVTGKPVRVTCEDFASEEEFLALKAWSDENFHAEDNRDVVEDKRRISIDEISKTALSVPATEVELEQKHERSERRRRASELVIQLKDKLTEIQFRRLWLYHIDGKTEEEIAAIEGVAQQQISKSLKAAEKKIKKFSS